jgi:hypothetical protein
MVTAIKSKRVKIDSAFFIVRKICGKDTNLVLPAARNLSKIKSKILKINLLIS